MSSFFDSGPLPDFKEIQKWLGKDLPWKLAEQWDKANDGSWLNDYIQSVLRKARTGADAGTGTNAGTVMEKKETLRTDVSKNDKFVTVRIWLPANAALKDVRLFAAPDRVKLTGLPNGRKHAVKLPALVLPRSGKADWNEGKLQVRFRRRPAQRDEVELFIRE